MKRCLSILLALILAVSSMTIIAHAEIVDFADSGAETELTVTSAGSVESAISWAISIANDNTHGYSQSRRYGPDYDCSSLVCTAFRNAGFSVSPEETTGTMKNAFINAGFTWIPASSFSGFPTNTNGLQRGDILLANGHTALYIGNDEMVHARGGYKDKYDEGYPGDQTGDEIAVTSYYASGYSKVGGWQGVLRYERVTAVDLGSKFYANIVPTASNSNGLASTGTNEGIAKTGDESWLWPVPSSKNVTQNYSSGHHGIDIGGDTSFDIVATKSGTVSVVYSGCKNYNSLASGGVSCRNKGCPKENLDLSGSNYPSYCNGGFGNGIVISHPDGTKSSYAHLSAVYVKSGDKVTQGQVIAKLGSSGYSQGPHLHFGCISKGVSYWTPDINNTPDTGIKYIYEAINYQDLGSKFYANIVPTGASSSLAVTGTSSDNVKLDNLSYSDYQQWLFEKDGSAYKITNVKRNKCLDIKSGTIANGTDIQLYTSNNTDAQRWYIVKNESGYYLLSKKNTDYAIDITGGTLSSGTNIELYKKNTSKAQRFSFVMVHTVAYNANGGTGSIANSSVSVNQKFTIKDNVFSKEGYHFAGYYYVNRKSDNTWYVTESGWVKQSSYEQSSYSPRKYEVGSYYTMSGAWLKGAATNDTFTFYPQWKSDNPALQFYGNYSGYNHIIGGSFDTVPSSTYPNGSGNVYTLSADSGNRLNTQNSLKIVGKSAGSTSNDVRFYTDTSRSCVNSDSAGDNKKMTLTFWAKSSVSNAKAYFRWGYLTATKNITLTTGWKQYTVDMTKTPYASPELCIYFDKAGTFYINSPTLTDGASAATNMNSETAGTVCKTQTFTYGEKYSGLPVPSRPGYTFTGWYTAKDGGTLISEDTDVYENEMRVYAHWDKNISETPVRSTEANGHRYELYDNPMTWEEANAFCEEKGGHLVTISDAAENDTIGDLIGESLKFAWIGLIYDENDKQWEWVTGEEVNYVNWNTNEPSTHNGDATATEKFGMFFPANLGTNNRARTWNDSKHITINSSYYGDHNSMFVCEYEQTLPQMIYIDQSDLMINIGESVQLNAYIVPEDTTQTILWDSEEKSVATIDENGVVAAVSPGSTLISATTVNGLTAICEVTVFEPIVEPEDINIDFASVSLTIGDNTQLSATVYPAEADQRILWYSENDEIATVSDSGLVTAIAEGDTVIYAETYDGMRQAMCEVYVSEPYIEPERVEWNGFVGFVGDDDTIYLYDYTGEDEEIVFPSTIDDKRVSVIGSYTLSEVVSCISVTIPADITEIGYHAIGYRVLDWSNGDFQEEKLNNIIIYGYSGSAAEEYASENGFTFFALDDEKEGYFRGDADGDGEITIFDATRIQRLLVGLDDDPDGMQTLRGTIVDDELSILDATAIQRYLAGFPNDHQVNEYVYFDNV